MRNKAEVGEECRNIGERNSREREHLLIPTHTISSDNPPFIASLPLCLSRGFINQRANREEINQTR